MIPLSGEPKQIQGLRQRQAQGGQRRRLRLAHREDRCGPQVRSAHRFPRHLDRRWSPCREDCPHSLNEGLPADSNNTPHPRCGGEGCSFRARVRYAGNRASAAHSSASAAHRPSGVDRSRPGSEAPVVDSAAWTNNAPPRSSRLSSRSGGVDLDLAVAPRRTDPVRALGIPAQQHHRVLDIDGRRSDTGRRDDLTDAHGRERAHQRQSALDVRSVALRSRRDFPPISGVVADAAWVSMTAGGCLVVEWADVRTAMAPVVTTEAGAAALVRGGTSRSDHVLAFTRTQARGG